MNRVAVSALEGRSDPESTSRYLTPTMTPVDSLANDSVNGSGPSPTTDSIESQPDVSGSAARNDPRVQRLLVSRRRRLSEALRRAGIDLMVTDNPVAGIWLDLDPRAPTLAIDHDGWTRLDPEPHPLSERLARLNIPQTATVGTDAGASHDLVVQASRLTGELSDATTAFRVARAAKDALELSLMRRAFAIAESAASDALETAGPGSIELDLAHAFERHARLAGADGQSYELSVATGHRTSRPWAGVTTTELEVPGPLQVDLGVWFKRYRADVSYARWVSDPTNKECGGIYTSWRQLHDGARTVHDAILDKIAPGIAVRDLAATAADATSRANTRAGSSAPHLAAHGLGLEIHEEPFVRRASTLELEPGMVLSVEPGLYLPVVGARTETVVVITDHGWEPLTTDRMS